MSSNPGTVQADNRRIGLQGLNGNLLCAIDVETTGLTLEAHEVWQVCILPLNSVLEPNKDFIPFYTDMKPARVDNIDPAAISLGIKDLGRLLTTARPTDMVADDFIEWFDRLKLAPGKKIVPLAHNFPFDRGFLRKWLGEKLYDDLFHYHYRDTMAIGAFLNDRQDSGCRPIPYTRLGLKNMCRVHTVVLENAHDAMADCLATAELYAKLCRDIMT